jgi:ppGpp synthetase/RelA/SpoT-type nucleotidyltranferase
LNRIGERLRKNTATEDDIRRLDEYRISFMPAFQKVYDELTAMGLRPGGRPQKTTPSIIAKLNREKTRLSTMQDIAGCRVEVPNITDQNRVADELVAKFPGANIQDRRSKPSHGYRAVHVIVEMDEKPVEIQIRTEMQHGWAVVTEKLADVIDHRIKYGGGSPDLQRTLTQLSEFVAQFENEEALITSARQACEGITHIDDILPQILEQHPKVVEQIRKQGGVALWLDGLEKDLAVMRRNLNELLKALLENYSIIQQDKPQ